MTETPRPEIRAGRILVEANYLLRFALGFDKEHRILAVGMSDDLARGRTDLEIVVGGPMMPVVEEGCFAPDVWWTLTLRGSREACPTSPA